MTPSIGRIVLYKLSAEDADAINRRRNDALEHIEEHRRDAMGIVVYVGNPVNEGEVYPMIIVQVWGDTPDSAVNGQVLLDGNSTLWVTSVYNGESRGEWMWPEKK